MHAFFKCLILICHEVRYSSSSHAEYMSAELRDQITNKQMYYSIFNSCKAC